MAETKSLSVRFPVKMTLSRNVMNLTVLFEFRISWTLYHKTRNQIIKCPTYHFSQIYLFIVERI